MEGVITRVEVLTHPWVIVESFGFRVLVTALLAGRGETFLDIVTRAAEAEEHAGQVEVDLARTVARFVGFERRVRDLYRALARRFVAVPEAARFFSTMSAHEEGHAILLTRVRRDAGRGRLWRGSRQDHRAAVRALEVRIGAVEAEVRRGPELGRALDLVESLERSELNVVFDTLSGGVDQRSRARLERFFVLTRHHLEYCAAQLRALRATQRIAPAFPVGGTGAADG